MEVINYKAKERMSRTGEETRKLFGFLKRLAYRWSGKEECEDNDDERDED